MQHGAENRTLVALGHERWYPEQDLNLHSFRNQILSLARLPFRHPGMNDRYMENGTGRSARNSMDEWPGAVTWGIQMVVRRCQRDDCPVNPGQKSMQNGVRSTGPAVFNIVNVIEAHHFSCRIRG